jgi:hypothetical protein
MKKITSYIGGGTYGKILEIAKRDEISISEAIKHIILEYFKQREGIK